MLPLSLAWYLQAEKAFESRQEATHDYTQNTQVRENHDCAALVVNDHPRVTGLQKDDPCLAEKRGRIQVLCPINCSQGYHFLTEAPQEGRPHGPPHRGYLPRSHGAAGAGMDTNGSQH